MEENRTEMQILLVEDNPGDALLVEEALEDSGVKSRLFTVADGVDAMKFLHNEPPYEEAPVPNLVLLDLNLPRMTGVEVLNAVKQDPDLRRIPVVILTTSTSPEDIRSSYDGYANSYVTKPVHYEQFVSSLKVVERFWVEVAELPPSASPVARSVS